VEIMSNSVILEHQVQDPRVLLDWRLGSLLRKAVFEHFVPKKCARQSNYSRGLGGTHFLRVSIVPLGARHAWPFEEMQLYGAWLALPVFSNAVEAPSLIKTC